MGCTSSAPNMPDVQSHTTENEKRETNDDKNNDDLKRFDTIEQKESEQAESTNVECNEIKILPTCDNLDQNLQLDRYCNLPPDIVNNDQERERDGDMVDLNDAEVDVIMEIVKEVPSIESGEEPQKFSTFEEVVGQVVLDNILEDIAEMPGVKDDDSQMDDKTTEENVIQDNPNEINAINSDELEIINDVEDLNETASPSQSECSRATRWEALADIAAELPPSLAVDPMTGQIFSLTK